VIASLWARSTGHPHAGDADGYGIVLEDLPRFLDDLVSSSLVAGLSIDRVLWLKEIEGVRMRQDRLAYVCPRR